MRAEVSVTAHDQGKIKIYRQSSDTLLGGFRKGGYETHMQTPLFQRGLDEREGLIRERRGAILCSESLPWRCHRRFIARALAARGWRVLHIIDAAHVVESKGISVHA
ncbi:MAG: DUF488 family protein [bacterium]